MKRIGNLYKKIANLSNIHLAELKARKGKSTRNYVIEFNKNRTENILEIYKELLNKTYTTSKYSHFVIFEPKRRELSRLPYKDRIVHHSILNILEPILKNCFISQTYSCIKYRGIHKCLNKLNFDLKDKENTKYCLKMDIKKFYPSIDHVILKYILETKFKDKELLNLLSNTIDSHIGVPLGNFTSQWFGNLYLNKFDHWLKEDKKIKYYYRYCDDLVILGDNKETLHKLRKEIEDYLFNNLKLKLSNYQVFPVESWGIDFLGYVSYNSHIKLRKSIKQRFKKMMRKPNSKSIASYNGWLKHANCRNLERKYLTNGRNNNNK